MPAPDVYGLLWTHTGTLRSASAGTVTAHFAEPTPAFEAAVAVAREALVRAGLHMTSGDYSRHGLGRVWRGAMYWEGVADSSALAEALAEAALTPAQRQARADEAEAREEEEWQAFHARRARGAVEDIQRIVRDYPWALAKDRAAAEHIAAAGDLRGMGTEAALEMARRAYRVQGSTRRRLEEWPMGAAQVERAALPGVAAAAHEACRYITSLDADRASVRNRKGWSPSTTYAGHLLAGMETLRERETVYALDLLHQYRRQIPPALAALLFAGAAV